MALSVQAIDRFITPGSPLARAGGARALLRATGGNLAGAAFLAALARKESSFGTTAGRFKNNFWGWGVHLGPSVNTSPTVEEGARKVWRGLQSGLYKGAGLRTPTAIIQRYAPPSENNTALYQQQVNSWFTQMGLSPQTDIFSGSTVPVPGAVPPPAPGAGAIPPQVAGNLDAKRLMMLLGNQRARSLRGLMPAAGFQRELQKVVSAALPNAQTGATARIVGAGAAQTGAAVGKAVTGILPTQPNWGSYGYADPEGQGGRHLAVDWMAPAGSPVRAGVAGTVVRLTPDPTPGQKASGQVFGGTLAIRMDDGRLVVMRHITPGRLRVGQRVAPTSIVGAVKNWAGSPHIHLETYAKGSSDREYSPRYAVNPRTVFG